MSSNKILQGAQSDAEGASSVADTKTKQIFDAGKSQAKSKLAGVRADESEELLRCTLREESERLRDLYHEARIKIEKLLPENAKLRQSIQSGRAVHWSGPVLPIIGSAVTGFTVLFAKQGDFWFISGNIVGIVVTIVGCVIVFLHQCLGWPSGD